MQKFPRWIIFVFIFVVAAAVSGCSIIKVQPDRSQFFMLIPTAKPDPGIENSRLVKTMWIGIGPFSTPAFLKRSEILVQLNDTQIEPSQWCRWAEPLDKNIPRVVSQNLTVLLENNNLMKYPWYTHEAPDYQVVINILNFVITADRKIVLSAQWEINEVHGRKREWNEKTNVTLSSERSDMASEVAVMSKALETLSRNIAQKLREVAALN